MDIRLNDIWVFHEVDSLMKILLTTRVACEWLSHELTRIHAPFCVKYRHGYQYSDFVSAYIDITNQIVMGKPYQYFIWCPNHALEFLKQFELYRSQLRVALNQQQQQEIRNRNALQEYLNNLTNHYARLLAVRIDLSYLTDQLSYVTLFDVQSHLNKLRDFISNKDSCFEHLQGYVWAIEQGSDKGIHCHMLLLYDGAERHKDYSIAQSIGEKWKMITNGKGSYFNCNTSKYKQIFVAQETLGIGMIHRNNPAETQNLLRVANYLVNPDKTSQHMVVKPMNMRTFGKGQYNVSWRRGV